ncbi:hypothetical protein [Tellurirhabdus bombi]|uniref:hypothetical protein n=1 Tax=Tellurirhabdus bombi TaxID=2907205 RepID=UPI001F1D7DBB|nr:hypothetical protein [Tellurirhabdus bombi]
MKRLLFLVLPLTIWNLSCSTGEKKDPALEEAAKYHNEATEIQAVVEPQIERIDSLKTLLTQRTEPAAKATVASLDSLKKAFEDWEGNLVEVPGMPHKHSHDHGDHEHHHHADATLKDLPADQMRDLQREILTNIKEIQKQTEATLKRASTLL